MTRKATPTNSGTTIPATPATLASANPNESPRDRIARKGIARNGKAIRVRAVRATSAAKRPQDAAAVSNGRRGRPVSATVAGMTEAQWRLVATWATDQHAAALAAVNDDVAARAHGDAEIAAMLRARHATAVASLASIRDTAKHNADSIGAKIRAYLAAPVTGK